MTERASPAEGTLRLCLAQRTVRQRGQATAAGHLSLHLDQLPQFQRIDSLIRHLFRGEALLDGDGVEVELGAVSGEVVGFGLAAVGLIVQQFQVVGEDQHDVRDALHQHAGLGSLRVGRGASLRGQHRRSGQGHFLPIVPMLLTIVYSVLYYAGADWLLHLFGDIAAFQSVMYILTFELCIACGYIHSNSRYVDLFASSVGTSAEITDKDFTVRYAAVNTAPISKEAMKKAEQSPVTMGGLTVHTMPIDGGYAVWTEDVSALRDIKEDSELLADELADRNEILRYEYKREAKRRKVEEQNRLYDLLRSATQTQIDRIAELTKEYRRISSTDPDSAKTLLAEIAVLCSYIKRRKHLTLLTDRDIKIAETELHRAFNESLQTLKLLGVRSSLYVDESLSMLSGKTATAVFDFYESVIEADILNLTGIQVSLIKANGLRLSLNVCCEADLSALVSGDSIRCEKEDDEEYQHLVFEAKEGDRK